MFIIGLYTNKVLHFSKTLLCTNSVENSLIKVRIFSFVTHKVLADNVKSIKGVTIETIYTPSITLLIFRIIMEVPVNVIKVYVCTEQVLTIYTYMYSPKRSTLRPCKIDHVTIFSWVRIDA